MQPRTVVLSHLRPWYRPATECYAQALDIAHQTGNRTSEQDALYSLGQVHFLQGRYGPATDCF